MKSTYKWLSTKPKGKSALLSSIASISAVALVATALNATAIAMPQEEMQKEKTTTSSSFKIAALPEELNDLGIESLTADSKSGIGEYKLKSNGLQILLVERHSTPVVMTTVVFHVGSRNEAVGYTGATHFLEHMMFKGTPKFDPLKKTGLDDLLKKVGGINNATTWYDRTNYYEVVPTGYLDLCLDIEADRMRNLLLRESDREAEMTVVRNELERGEDDPNELLDTNLFATSFREHPYHHPVIGWRSDVEGVPTERLRKFYDDFYWPNNATLMVIGDFNKVDALKSIAKHFNAIPKAPNAFPSVYTKEPPQEGERRFVVKRGSDVPRLMVGFHGPECLNKDTYALDVVETILGGTSKRSSRLYKRLIETGLASETEASSYSLKDPGMFVVSGQITVGTNPEQLEVNILDELQRLKTEKVTQEELERAKRSIIKGIRLSIDDPMSLSSQLTEAIAVADWKWWLNYPDEVNKITEDDVMRVARKYFRKDNRTVGYYYPKNDTTAKKGKKKVADEDDFDDEETATAHAPDAVKAGTEEKSDQFAAKTPIESPKDKKADEPATPDPTRPASSTGDTTPEASIVETKPIPINIGKRVTKVQLPNGLTLLVLPLEDSTTIAVSGKIVGGDQLADLEKSSVPYLVSELLNKGSSKYTKLSLADALDNMGTDLEFSTTSTWTEFDTHVVKEDLPQMVDIISDLLQKPSFPKAQLTLEKKLKEADLQVRMSDTSDVAWNHLSRKLYKPTAGYYQKSFEDQIAELAKIQQKDLVDFHAKHYGPGNTVLTFVGNVKPDEIKELCQKYFASWPASKRETVTVAQKDVNAIEHSEEIITQLPDKSNVDIQIGKPLSTSLHSDDYFAAVLGNAALGYDSFACRLAPVRDKYGLTYGISSSIEDPTNKFGPWTIKLSVNPENVDKSRKIVADIVKEYIKDGITEAELETEKSHLSGVFSVYLRSARHIANRLAMYEVVGMSPNYIDDYPANISKVTRDDVNQAIRKYFDIGNSVTSIAGTLKVTDTVKR